MVFFKFLIRCIFVTSFSAKLIYFLNVIKLTLPFTSLVEMSTALNLQGTWVLDNFLLAPPNTIEWILAEQNIKKDFSNMVSSIIN